MTPRLWKSVGIVAALLVPTAALLLWGSSRFAVDLQTAGADARSLWTDPYFHLGGLAVTPAFLLKSLLFLIFLFVATRLIQLLVTRLLARTSMEVGQRYALERVSGYLFFVVGLIVGIQSAGLDLSALTFLGGAVGIGVGFGLQNIAKNFASGLVLLVERPVKVGDRVEVGELIGDVTHIGGRSTRVRTNDNVVVIIPNSEFVEQRVTNWTANDRQIRVTVPLGVSYESDPEDVSRILSDTAAAHPDVLATPAPDVIFKGFGDSSLDFELRVWTINQVRTPTILRSQLYYAIFDAFRARGIEIPFPQRDLHLRSSALQSPPPGLG